MTQQTVQLYGVIRFPFDAPFRVDCVEAIDEGTHYRVADKRARFCWHNMATTLPKEAACFSFQEAVSFHRSRLQWLHEQPGFEVSEELEELARLELNATGVQPEQEPHCEKMEENR